MREDGKIDYVEFFAGDMARTQEFYKQAFGWSYQDYGPDYQAFKEGLDGGFYTEATKPKAPPLVILYAKDLEAALARVQAAGGEITQPIFEFPGGRRFHFRDPAGNELAVWSDAGIN